jgi:hypothetical protein
MTHGYTKGLLARHAESLLKAGISVECFARLKGDPSV